MKKLSILFAAMLLVLGIAAESFAAIYAPKVFSETNNLTLLDNTGALVGGTNDVYFNWNETMKTAVTGTATGPLQVSNAVLASTCPFNGTTWSAHDVAIYGPGTYTVYTDCLAGRPACGAGTPITFTVNAGEIGVHLLLNWNGNTNIDVVNIWAPNRVFGPSPMYTGACGSNWANTLWTLMSRDPGGTGINGVAMVDAGTLGASYANFNVMRSRVNTTGNNFTMVAPDGTLTGGTNDVRVTWDGVPRSAVAISGQRPNASISSTCPFLGITWLAHDVVIYGPGTYTVNPCCTAGSPGCATTCLTSDGQLPIEPITFTVGAGELGGHMLLNWSINANFDVVEVWSPNMIFGPSPLFDGTAPGGCGSNSATTTWTWMSRDWGSCSVFYTDLITGDEACAGVADGVLDNLNGAPMVDGPFNEQNANFNWMGYCACPPPPPCQEAFECDPETLVCGYHFLPDGTACDDGNACTMNNVCINGVCTGGIPLVCTALDQCHVAGTCHTSTGVCSNPPASNGTSCNDNDLCTTGDACINGVCGGTAVVCPTGLTCNPSTGICGGGLCANVVCTASDQCHAAGTCDPATGICSNPMATNGKPCNDGIFCNGTDACSGGTCTHSGNPCPTGSTCNETTDHCDPNFVAIDTTNNNLTVIAPDGSQTGGTNDVHFTWDVTMKTSVAISGQVSNATISSICPFSGLTWKAHDVAIYGPGTYTVNPCCPAGSPGCAATCLTSDGQLNISPITFTVGPGELGGHMLIDWSIDHNLDVVDVWAPNQVFAPSPLFDGTSPGGCGTNPATKVWSWMSKDWGSCSILYTDTNTLNEACAGIADGVLDNLNGAPMVDGPLNDQNVNFNWMVGVCTGSCDDGNACTTDTYGANCACVNTPINCNDNNACTADSCDPAIGCVHTPVICPTGQVCDPVNGSCGAVNLCAGKFCNDNEICTADACDIATGACVHSPVSNGIDCSPELPGGTAGSCFNGM